MKVGIAFAALALALAAAPIAEARDVYVRGYTRSNGTYVQPYVRSSPDSSRANNYGPSSTSPNYSTAPRSLYGGSNSYGSNSLYSPQTRDSDRDGIANRYDSDDDNDGISDNHDRSQYGSGRRY